MVWNGRPVRLANLKLSFDWMEGWDKTFQIEWDPAGLSRAVEKPGKHFNADHTGQVESPKERVFVMNKPNRIQGTAVNG